MTQQFFVGWLVIAITLIAGCAKAPSDGAPSSAQREQSSQLATSPAEPASSPDIREPQPPAKRSLAAAPSSTASARSDSSLRGYSLPSNPVALGPSREPAATGAPLAAPSAMPAAEAVTPSAITGASETDETEFQVVEVFYGTDRARIAATAPNWSDYVRHFRGTVAALAFTLVGAGTLVLRSRFRAAVVAGAVGVGFALVLGLMATSKAVSTQAISQRELVRYGDGRGKLEYGICQVSIPKDHRIGELESPSVLRLEFRETPERHVMILESRALPPDEFFHHVQDSVAASSRRELLVFVHGYNVAFDHAVRRTAQIAYDLQFKGPAVCYSWPSHGGLLQYAADETNVEWTVPHLKQFLTELREKSGANAINLVAHSMGTRALTNALRDFARESQASDTLFHQVVLAAPDIDAEVFRRDLAPAMTKIAGRVTLYASSNDQALRVSRKLHAYPRAGESGENLVVAPGIDTIDVSAVDTSLLGHSYYGDNDSIITDLFHLVHDALPPHLRAGLHPATYAGLPYWIFVPIREQARRSGAALPH